MKKITLLFISILTLFQVTLHAQHSISREWNDELLEAIRKDFARPTVHARNLFHSSVLMYDAWAIFDNTAETVFLGKTYGSYTCNFNGIANPTDVAAARKEIISYAMFRLLNYRFANSPGASTSLPAFETKFTADGYDKNFTSTDYSTGSYAALGNYMASEMIAFGNQDHSNEQNNYGNLHYSPVNDPLILELYEDNDDINPNRWQPLAFDVFIGQSGIPFPLNTPNFLSPEWGEVTPFCLLPQDLQVKNNGFDSYVYNDPGAPEYIQNSTNGNGINDPYKWHFLLVASWSQHLDPADNTMIDISPASIGNINPNDFPTTFQEYQNFYDFTNGGDLGTGHALNPVTNQPYTPQMVKRADYGRVLAEFWADGPDSETPPGHWFTILNYVSDHPLVEKKIGGQGNVVSDLEWDVKNYLALGGAMHDAAVNTWGIKGYYDYIRPISAIRYMAAKGQSSDPNLPNFDPHGIPLVAGLTELIQVGDPLAGTNNENVNEIKVKAWKGPDYISDPTTDIAGVDWILAKKWWPYQRATFVTPPFAGYLSGHSTFSRAAAEVLTLMTGDAFFPGGMGTFDVTQNDFLFFEQGPSTNMTLQWATYRDASDQTSLSRIWGGIHPPIDDIRGRIIGEKIGTESYNLALEYFNPSTLSNSDFNSLEDNFKLFPVPFNQEFQVAKNLTDTFNLKVYDLLGKEVINTQVSKRYTTINTESLNSGVYFAKFFNSSNKEVLVKKIVKK